MSDGSKEETVEKSTDELLSETDDILRGMDTGGDADAGGDSSSEDQRVDDAMADLEADAGSRDRSASRASSTASGTDDRRFKRYFDPKSAGISAVLVFAGAMAGGLIPIPFVGGLARLLGVGVGAFAHGLGASDSRYAETLVASSVVGFLVALVTTNMFLTLSGIGVPILAVSTIATTLVALVGHYFGRDLRAGLTADVEGGGGDDDVPGW